MLEQPSYTAIQIAKYFIKIAIDEKPSVSLTNLKLQKILYYAQGWYIANFNKLLFDDPIEAWEFGPVIPNVYHEYKRYRNRPIVDIPTDNDINVLDVKTKEFLEKVWNVYKNYTGTQLVDFTHMESPWKEGRKIRADKPMYQISIESIEKTFKKRLKRD